MQQIIRPKVTTLLPTKQESLQICQQLIMTAATNVTYLRGLLPESAFEDVAAYGMTLKCLKRGASKAGDTLLDWFQKGCFDAIQKGYLKTIVLGIYVDPNNPKLMLETYTFNITYNSQGQPDVVVKNSDKVVAHLKSTKNEIEKASLQLMRTLCLFTQTLAPLPDERYLTMKLHYYDEMTPHDYNPPLFRSGTFDESMFLFQRDPTKLRLGQVHAHHHGMEMKVYTNVEEIDEQENDDGKENMDVDVGQVVIRKNNKEETQDFNYPQSSFSQPERLQHFEPPKRVKENTCPCGGSSGFDRGQLIECTRCNNVQHSICMGIVKPDHLPDDYQCYNCRFPNIAESNVGKRKLYVLSYLRCTFTIMMEINEYNPGVCKDRAGVHAADFSTLRAVMYKEGITEKDKQYYVFDGRKKEVQEKYRKVMSDQILYSFVPGLPKVETQIMPAADPTHNHRISDSQEVFNTQKTVLLDYGQPPTKKRPLALEPPSAHTAMNNAFDFVPDSQPSMLDEMSTAAQGKKRKVSMASKSIRV